VAHKRAFTTFNLSFLDIMSCGFGAVILIFLIIDHSIEEQSQQLNNDLLSESNMLEEDVQQGEKNLVSLRNTLSTVDLKVVEARGRANRIIEKIKNYENLLLSLENKGLTSPSEIERQQNELLLLEQEILKLKTSSDSEDRLNARSFLGDGDRQYLTGLNLGGKRILILLDRSASMLADNIINIIRIRNMDDDAKLRAEKWRRAVNTVAWLSSNLPIASDFQIITFNTTVKPLVKNTLSQWLPVSDRQQLDLAIESLDSVIPKGGTSLENVFLSILDLSPLPDNIFLITDGLPTQGAARPRNNTVNARERQRLFRDAVELLPKNIPINIILAPMEGDPMAPSEFWQLAQNSNGAFVSPAKDWP
jgi:hypothetical protein